jgi:hypothetical protein
VTRGWILFLLLSLLIFAAFIICFYFSSSAIMGRIYKSHVRQDFPLAKREAGAG